MGVHCGVPAQECLARNLAYTSFPSGGHIHAAKIRLEISHSEEFSYAHRWSACRRAVGYGHSLGEVGVERAAYVLKNVRAELLNASA